MDGISIHSCHVRAGAKFALHGERKSKNAKKVTQARQLLYYVVLMQ
jgi:hypothetical protein